MVYQDKKDAFEAAIAAGPNGSIGPDTLRGVTIGITDQLNSDIQGVDTGLTSLGTSFVALQANFDDVLAAVPYNHTATSDPTASDDGNNSSGNGVFSFTSKWLNSSSGDLFICESNATGAAVWVIVDFNAASLGALAVLDTVGSAQIANDAVTTAKIADNAVTNSTLMETPENISSNDWDDYTDTGIYTGNNMSNSPDGSANWFKGLVIPHNFEWCTQLLTNFTATNPEFFFRTQQTGVWSSWKKLIDESSAGMEKILDYTEDTNVGQVDFTGLSAFRILSLHFRINVTVDNAARVNLRTSTDNGSSFDNGASDYKWAWHGNNTGNTEIKSSDNADSEIQFTEVLGNATGEGMGGVITMYGFNQSDYMILKGEIWYFSESGTGYAIQVGGTRLNTTARDAFTLIASSGLIASGSHFYLQGIRS